MSRTTYPVAVTAAVPFPRLSNHQGGILALDLSREWGWSYGHPGERDPHSFGTIRLSDTTHAGRMCAFEEGIEDKIEELRPRHIVLEAPLPLPAHTALSISRQQLTMDSLVWMAGWRASVSVSAIDVQTVRRDILGRGYFSRDTVKREVMQFCRRRGWRVETSHEGDACLVWLWHCHQVRGVRPAAGPLFAEAV